MIHACLTQYHEPVTLWEKVPSNFCWKIEGKKRSPLTFYDYQLFQGPSQFSTILWDWHPFPQYVVDRFCKVKSERLKYLRKSLLEVCATDYTEWSELLVDLGNSKGKTDAFRSDLILIFAMTYTGRGQYTLQNVHGILALSNPVGYPDNFLTTICDQQSKEIKDALPPERRATHQPDLFTCIFCIERPALMVYIIHEEIFGEIISHLCVTESRKGGLPHGRIIFSLSESWKLSSWLPNSVGSITSTKLESGINYALCDVILKHNMEDACDVLNCSSVRLIDGSSSKNVSARYLVETCHEDSQQEFTYRRWSPNNGRTRASWNYRRGNFPAQSGSIESAFAVQCSPKLSLMFQSHLNEKLCVSWICTVRYLFNCAFNGHNLVSTQLVGAQSRYDQLSQFKDAPYLSATGALWRLFQLDITDLATTFARLSAYLENHHTIFFREDRQLFSVRREQLGTNPKVSLKQERSTQESMS